MRRALHDSSSGTGCGMLLHNGGTSPPPPVYRHGRILLAHGFGIPLPHLQLWYGNLPLQRGQKLVLFVVVSYLDLVALFGCLRYYERLDRQSPRRETVKAAVWALTTLLTVIFSYKVAEIMPLAVKVVVWAMAAATTCGGFYAFFLYEEKQPLPAAGTAVGAPAAAAARKDSAAD
ncbi:hypothetical protein PR202_ga15087 [Eleusine coracana subsp. coracana]|uniref:Uncharacterized protein n=1 Tax=Eleusine coracana subsp. coracana TaxID=191504 RepID=A0AAV5CJ49_ELECO|nr:hypothetical protein PR202_ga15087 [Eleusine coracana subsp. coracana]